jgi:hypothetical protein
MLCILLLMACTKKEYRAHRCFPSCIDITIEGQVSDTINNQVANVPFEVFFIHNPSGWISFFPVKDKLICSSLSDRNGRIKETFRCNGKELDDSYSVYVSFKKAGSNYGFYIDEVPDSQPVTFTYYKR